MEPYINHISRFFYNRSVGLLFVRIVAGGIFIVHGWAKVNDMAHTITFFDSYGLSPLIAVMIAWLELLGGAALILGIAPRIMAGLLGIEMLVATLLVFSNSGADAAQFPLLLGAASFGIMLVGSGRFALYTMECGTCNGLFCIKKNRVCVMPA